MSLRCGESVGLVESYGALSPDFPPTEVDRIGKPVYQRLPDCPKKRLSSVASWRIRNHIFSAILAKRQEDMYEPISVALTLISVEITPAHEKTVIVFAPSSTIRLDVEEGTAPKADLVAFFAPRAIAHEVIVKSGEFQHALPSTHEVVAIVEISSAKEPMDQCIKTLPLVARHRPSSVCHYGLSITRDYFRLLSLGPDFTRVWRRVKWISRSCLKRLSTCVEMIRDEAIRSSTKNFMAPRLTDVLKKGTTLLATYCANANGRRYDLFPVFTGRDPSSRPFTAIASHGEHLKDARILKYSWRRKDKPHLEYQILKKVQDAPGVVQMDDDLCSNRVDCDPSSGFIQSVLATRVNGYPLSSCRSVREFLEAMYDLLEVLRYLAREKKVLHRDINWRSVLLVRPEDAPNVKDVITLKETDEPIKHRYRFISNIYNEEKIRVRIALCDFERAADLSTGRADDLSNSISTQMFMAYDILETAHFCERYTDMGRKTWEISGDKYHDIDEKISWDEFYSEVDRLEFRVGTRKALGKPRKTLEHSAAHDAESVFYLCALFFCRMERIHRPEEIANSKHDRIQIFSALVERHVDPSCWNMNLSSGLQFFGSDPQFLGMLEAASWYFEHPWSTLSSTNQGGCYEFHAHDFLQRLILKELNKMLEQGDNIPIEDMPVPVRTIHLILDLDYRYRGKPCDLPDLLLEWQGERYEEALESSVLGKRKREDEAQISPTCRGDGERPSFGPSDSGSRKIPEEFMDLLKIKKEENYWLVGSRKDFFRIRNSNEEEGSDFEDQ